MLKNIYQISLNNFTYMKMEYGTEIVRERKHRG